MPRGTVTERGWLLRRNLGRLGFPGELKECRRERHEPDRPNAGPVPPTPSQVDTLREQKHHLDSDGLGSKPTLDTYTVTLGV